MKNKLIWIAVPVFLMIGYIFLQWTEIDSLKEKAQLQAVELSTLKDSVQVYRDKAGELTYKLISVEVDKGNLKEALGIMGFNLKKLKDKDIQWRKVTSALRMQLAATGSGETTLIDTMIVNNTDTISLSKFDWSNNYLSLFGNINGNNMKFDYSYRTGIDFITTKNRKSTVVSVMLSDPNAAIISGNSITVTHKKRFYEKGWVWGVVGLGAGILISK